MITEAANNVKKELSFGHFLNSCFFCETEAASIRLPLRFWKRHSGYQTTASSPVVEPGGRRSLYRGNLSIVRRANACPPECPPKVTSAAKHGQAPT